MKGLKVTAGNILLRMEPQRPKTVGGMEAASARKSPYDTAVVVQIGEDDGMFKISSIIEVGAHFIVPQTSKTTFSHDDGFTYIVVHHKDLKVRVE